MVEKYACLIGKDTYIQTVEDTSKIQIGVEPTAHASQNSTKRLADKQRNVQGMEWSWCSNRIVGTVPRGAVCEILLALRRGREYRQAG